MRMKKPFSSLFYPLSELPSFCFLFLIIIIIIIIIIISSASFYLFFFELI